MAKQSTKNFQKIGETLELVLTPHALERLNDFGRFATRPDLPLNEEVRFLQFRRTDTKEVVWMCQIQGGFLVGQRKTTRRRQILVVMTALSREMFHGHHYIRLACHRVTVDKITEQAA